VENIDKTIIHDDRAYEEKITQRNWMRLILGFFARLKSYLKQAYCRRLARRRGATIGKTSIIPYALAKNANANLIVGEHCCISTSNIDLRAKVVIGDYVAISNTTQILRVSHDIDSPTFDAVFYDLEIDDYAWLVGCLILPRVTRIGLGAVCGCGSVVTHNVSPMSVVGGNPAKELRLRKCVHYAYSTEDLNSGDFLRYCRCLKAKWRGKFK